MEKVEGEELKLKMKKILIYVILLLMNLFLVSASQITYIPFGEGTGTIAEDIISSHNLTISSDGDWTFGKYNYGLKLKGSGAQINFTDMPVTDFSSQNFTIEIWVNLTNSGLVQTIFRHTDVNKGVIIQEASTCPYWGFYLGDGSGYHYACADAIPTNEWHHIAFTYNGTTIVVYYDGVKNSSADWTGTIDFSGITTTAFGGSANGLWGVIDEFKFWNEARNETQIQEDMKSSEGIFISLVSPPQDSAFSSSTLNFSAKYQTTLLNLTNATLYIWNSTGIFNKTTETITGKTNSTNITIFGLSIGNYKWNVLACGENLTSSVCSFAESNYTFTIGASLADLNYNNETYETASETFSAGFNILEGSEISLAQLIYNGANYTISDITYINSTYLTLNKTIDIPTNPNLFENATRSFSFKFIYGGDQVQETSTYQQNVSFINLQKCNATYSTTTLNFSYRKEDDNSLINASSNHTSMEVSFFYWLGSGTTYKNYSFQNLSMTDNQVKFCLYPSHITLRADMNMDYEVEDYSPRQYYFRNVTLTNQTREIDLINLLVDYSVKFFVSVKQGLDFVDGAIITINKFFTGEGSYKAVGMRKTDENGEFIEYFDLDKNYRFDVVKDGELIDSIERWITCEEAPCTLTLYVEEAKEDFWQGYYDIYATNVAYNLDYNDTTKMVTFDFTDLTGLARYFRLEVSELQYNGTSNNICNKTLYSTSGSLDCNMTGYTGQFIANIYVSRSPEKLIDFLNFVVQTLKETFGSLGIFVTLLFIITIALVGAWNPAVGVVLVAFSVMVMTFLGFTAFSFATITAIFILAILLLIKIRS